MKKKFIISILLLALIPSTIVIWDRYEDQKVKVSIVAQSIMYSTAEDAAYSRKSPVRVLQPKENIKVVRATYGKDYWALQVKANDGTKGWVIAGEQGVTIECQK